MREGLERTADVRVRAVLPFLLGGLAHGPAGKGVHIYRHGKGSL